MLKKHNPLYTCMILEVMWYEPLYNRKWERESQQGGARGVMVIIVGNGHGDTSSNPGRDCISHSTNTLEKGMNPNILPPAMGK